MDNWSVLTGGAMYFYCKTDRRENPFFCLTHNNFWLLEYGKRKIGMIAGAKGLPKFKIRINN